MKANEIRQWLDGYVDDEENVWIDGPTLVLEGSDYPLDRLEVGLQPDHDKDWRARTAELKKETVPDA